MLKHLYVCRRTEAGLPMHGPVGFLDITSLTLPRQHKPSLGFLSHCSMGKTHIFITVEPVAPHNLSLFASAPCLLFITMSIIRVLSNQICLRAQGPDTLERRTTRCFSLEIVPAFCPALPLDTFLSFAFPDFSLFFFFPFSDLICNISTY